MSARTFGNLVWEDVGKPTMQAAVFGSVVFGIGWAWTGLPQGGVMPGLCATAIVLGRKYLLTETIEAVRRPAAKAPTFRELHPWETKAPVRTEVTVWHKKEVDANYLRGTPYGLPVDEIKIRRAAFHYIYMGGRFSHNYLENPRHKPKIMTKGEFKKLEHYLVNRGAAAWKGSDGRGGVELLEDARELLSFFGRLYIPSPSERKELAYFIRTGRRTYPTQAYTEA